MFIGLLIFLATTIPTSATVPQTIPTTSDITAPTPPILIAPPDTTTLSDPSPTFIWSQSKDPNSNVVIYTLYLNGTSIYPNIGSVGNSAGPNYITRLEGNTIHLTPTYALSDGHYAWYVTARDLSGNISHSTTWNFTIDTSIPPYAATISQLPTTRYYLPIALTTLLSIAILLLLIFLWRRRYNIILLNAQLRPIQDATIYHSLPPLESGVYHLTSSDHGRLFIPHLSRYSTLTIRVQTESTCITTILSISVKQKVYTIVL